MTYSFSTRSMHNLSSCDSKLQSLCKEVIKIINFTIIEGHRGKEKQNRYYREGKSQLQYPESKHNKKPSQAVDIVPYPTVWSSKQEMTYLSGIFVGLANQMDIDIRVGIDWDMDGLIVPEDEDETFADYPHVELA